MRVIASRSRGTLVAVAEKCFLLDGLFSPPALFRSSDCYLTDRRIAKEAMQTKKFLKRLVAIVHSWLLRFDILAIAPHIGIAVFYRYLHWILM